ncbi:MAG: LPS biosynthesis protein PseA [Legionellales bacterium]|nr:LPS biosynthesis protein PseA [Legionellales bacterium]
MNVIPYPDSVDLKQYSSDLPDAEPYYGLPEKIMFCCHCTYSNQKPNSEKEYIHKRNSKKPTLHFDENGVCSACKVAEVKKEVNWESREEELKELCDRYRRNDGQYDCLVPGSGGKDSFYAAHKLKYKYGMNPLTVTWAPHIYTEWGWKNFQAWMHAGFDNYLFTPNGRVHRLLTRLSLEQLFHPFQPFMMGQMYFPPKIAAQLDIPLVFYGENPTEYGNDSKANGKATKDKEYFTCADQLNINIAGTSIKDLKKHFKLSDHDLNPYVPPEKKIVSDANLNVQYLGYYIPWHPQECYYYAVEHGGFIASPERSAGTYSKYSSIDDKIDDLHYYTTFIKFGIGRATYDSSQETRNGELEREEGVRLVKRFDGEYSNRFEKEIFDYLSIPKEQFPIASKMFEQTIMDKPYFQNLTDRFRSPHLWRYINGEWKLRRVVWEEPMQPISL